jgi:hypothetical protein
MELNFGYVVRNAMCSLWTKTCTKLLSRSFNMIYLVFMLDLPKRFFKQNINIFLCPASKYSLNLHRFTFYEFIMILGLLEIFIPTLCLYLNRFSSSRSRVALGIFVGCIA